MTGNGDWRMRESSLPPSDETAAIQSSLLYKTDFRETAEQLLRIIYEDWMDAGLKSELE